MSSFIITNKNDLEQVAHAVIGLSHHHTVFCLYGDLGAGKTTLVKSVANLLGVKDMVSSPTYPIINEYHLSDYPVYHIDLYRINSEGEALSIGLEEYLYSGNLCFVEWPDHFERLLPDNHIKLFIRKLEAEKRTIEIVIT